MPLMTSMPPLELSAQIHKPQTPPLHQLNPTANLILSVSRWGRAATLIATTAATSRASLDRFSIRFGRLQTAQTTQTLLVMRSLTAAVLLLLRCCCYWCCAPTFLWFLLSTREWTNKSANATKQTKKGSRNCLLVKEEEKQRHSIPKPASQSTTSDCNPPHWYPSGRWSPDYPPPAGPTPSPSATARCGSVSLSEPPAIRSRVIRRRRSTGEGKWMRNSAKERIAWFNDKVLIINLNSITRIVI